MKNLKLFLFCFLFLFCGFMMSATAQCRGGSCSSGFKYKRNGPQWSSAKPSTGMSFYLDSTYVYPEAYSSYDYYDDDEKPVHSSSWERKGFGFFIGSNAYFASKKTANYYNGAPENVINLNLVLKNEYYTRYLIDILKENYRYIDTAVLKEEYNRNSHYNVAMDVAVGISYRIHRNWYFELAYSFRRLTASNVFTFRFPGVPPGNNPPDYSKNQHLGAKEDRHYIDLSLGYIFQMHEIVKPFLSVGAQFTYIRIKEFKLLIEDAPPIDLAQMARYPDYIPGVQDLPNYVDWAGPGYGFFLNFGLKIAFHPAVSIDPVFQLSVASFGNSKLYLPSFYTNLCFNYVAGVRLVLNDGLFVRNK
ncbi:MAG: hypothetical protein FWH59_00600 [Lentimicrobiaceae bacterium]|nr:hypothetical protein [Lentimicrobiaceae bacterium]